LLKRVVWGLAVAAIGWLVGVWPPPVWWRTHWPTETAMMRLRAAPVDYQTVPLARLPAVLQRMVIIGEDSRFRTHHGLDFEEIRDALGLDRGAGFGPTVRAIWKRRDRLRGASTISQQLAKNLYLSPSRNPLRKVKEALTALRLEGALSKDRILELYLNLVELGPGVWGVPAASAHYFGVPAIELSEAQAAALAATLPFPLSSNPAYRSARMLHRRDLILARYHGVDVYIPPEEELDSLPAFAPPIIPPVLDTLTRDTIMVPVESLPADTVPDSTRDSTQSTSRRGITRAR
jgi:monofunctional biosynthetic peptidoglycan transglycosylase